MTVTENALVSLLSGELATSQQEYLITTLDEQPSRIAEDYGA